MGFQAAGINELVIGFEKLSQASDKTIVIQIFTTLSYSSEWDELEANTLITFRIFKI
jgi:hypothetical protein